MGLATRGPIQTPDPEEAADHKMNLTDVEAVGTKVPRTLKKQDKRSMDYILRTGLAGGLAGCAVSRFQSMPLVEM